MFDRLSQLQTCLDQLVTQFFSSINYINQNHDMKIPEMSPSHVTKIEDPEPSRDSPEKLQSTIKELSKDIVTKAKQIEVLIDSLPGLDNVTGDLEKLEQELVEARAEEEAAKKEREAILEQCDELIMKVASYKTEIETMGS